MWVCRVTISFRCYYFVSLDYYVNVIYAIMYNDFLG